MRGSFCCVIVQNKMAAIGVAIAADRCRYPQASRTTKFVVYSVSSWEHSDFLDVEVGFTNLLNR